MKNPDDIRLEIFNHALEQFPEAGWSLELIHGAAEQAGYKKTMVRSVFPDGLPDILKAFAALIDRRMMDKLAGIDPQDMRVRDRIKTAAMQRFYVMNEVRKAEKSAMAYWVRPFRKVEGAKILWRSCDKIWNWAGDNAQDYNHYTKRALLAGVMASTSCVWLRDNDPDLGMTEDFLDKRIENVMQFGRVLGKLKKAA